MQQSLCSVRLIQNNRKYLDGEVKRTHIKTRSKGLAGVAHRFISTLILGTEDGATGNRGFSCNWTGGTLTDSYLIAI
jgi:hypothetical protein